MAQFVPITPGIDITSGVVLSLLDGFGPFRTRAIGIMEKYGLSDFENTEWFPQKDYLNAFKEIAETFTTAGGMTLYQVGTKIPENALWPPEIQTIEDALASIDVAYHMNHRKDGKVMFNPGTGEMLEGIGHYGFETVGDREAKMLLDNPYPCDFDRGIVRAVALKFRPKDGVITVKHDDNAPCRNKGDDSCTCYVKW